MTNGFGNVDYKVLGTPCPEQYHFNFNEEFKMLILHIQTVSSQMQINDELPKTVQKFGNTPTYVDRI